MSNTAMMTCSALLHRVRNH